jgi:hypothetical protein
MTAASVLMAMACKGRGSDEADEVDGSDLIYEACLDQCIASGETGEGCDAEAVASVCPEHCDFVAKLRSGDCADEVVAEIECLSEVPSDCTGAYGLSWETNGVQMPVQEPGSCADEMEESSACEGW